MSAVERFLAECQAYAERKFWIQRTYDHLLFAGFVTQPISLPRSLKQAPHLEIVAQYRAFEVQHGRSPTREELARWLPHGPIGHNQRGAVC